MVWSKIKQNYWLILIPILLLYAYRLDLVPVHLNQDELQFALNGYSIATTGMSEYDQSWPLYFWHLDSFWATPFVSYLPALLYKLLPFNEITSRLATVLVSVGSIGVIMALVHKIFKNKFFAVTAAIMMATTPAFFINSRILLDNVYPILFVSLWLLFLYSYGHSHNKWIIFLSGLALGLGIHSYHATKIFMPFYYLLTLVYLVVSKSKRVTLLYFSTGFFVSIIIFIPWLVQHPDTLLNQVSYVSAIDNSIDASKGYLAVFTPERLYGYINSYLSYLTPKVLFIEGDRSLIHSTRQVGLFLFPMIFLIVFGILDSIRRKDWFAKLVLIGFVTYPMAAALINDPQRISRGMVVVPFAILLSVYGINFLIKAKDKLLRYLLIFVLIFMSIQFVIFLSDYFGKYRERSAGYFNFDIGGAMESAINSTRIRDVKNIYFEERVPFSLKYYKFYSLKHGSEFSNVFVFNNSAQPFYELPENSLVVIRPSEVGTRENIIGSFEKIEIIREPDGTESYWIFFSDKL